MSQLCHAFVTTEHLLILILMINHTFRVEDRDRHWVCWISPSRNDDIMWRTNTLMVVAPLPCARGTCPGTWYRLVQKTKRELFTITSPHRSSVFLKMFSIQNRQKTRSPDFSVTDAGVFHIYFLFTLKACLRGRFIRLNLLSSYSCTIIKWPLLQQELTGSVLVFYRVVTIEKSWFRDYFMANMSGNISVSSCLSVEAVRQGKYMCLNICPRPHPAEKAIFTGVKNPKYVFTRFIWSLF